MAELGFIGLGRMGGNMVARMLDKISVVIWDRTPNKMGPLIEKGAVKADSIEEMVKKLNTPRVVWMMLPAGEVTENYFNQLLSLLSAGDTIIDGANSHYKESVRHYNVAAQKGIKFLDVGVSGGIVAARNGYPMMIGGEDSVYQHCLPIFSSVGIEDGFARVGGAGAGHYVKMIHNAIEYGMMQAISEGFDLLANGSLKDLDLKQISKIWNRETIVSSFLMRMVSQALDKDANLAYLRPYVEDSGEGRWGAIEALENDVPFVVNSYALNARYISRGENSYAFRLLAAMRNEFGGHSIKK